MTVVLQSIKEACEERAKLTHDSRQILNKADAEKRDLNPEEKKSFDDMMAKVDDLGNRISDLEKSGANEDDDPPEDESPEAPKKDEESERDCKERNAQRLRRAELSMRVSQGRVSERRIDTDCAMEVRATKRYAKAYSNWIRSGHIPAEYRDLSLGTGSAGGYLVTPVKLSDDIVIAINNLVFVRQMAQITKVVDAQSLGNPQLTADIQGITWGNEVTVSAADTSMAFGRRDLTPNMATNLILVSYRELQASPRVEEVLSQRIALSFAYGEETAYLTGSGSGQPLGVFTASASGVPTSQDVTATGASHTIAADDLFEMVYKLPQQYQNSKNFCWVMHRAAVKGVVKLKDANGQYLWAVGGYTSGLTGNRGDTLAGFPVKQSEYAPSTFATNAYIAVLGDFTYYRIAETMDMEIQRLVELYAATGQVGFLSRKFLDGSPVLPAAFARLKLA